MFMISFSYDDPDPQLTTDCYLDSYFAGGEGESLIVVAVAAGVVDPLFLHRWRRLTLTFLAIADSPSRRETSAFTSILSVPGGRRDSHVLIGVDRWVAQVPSYLVTQLSRLLIDHEPVSVPYRERRMRRDQKTPAKSRFAQLSNPFPPSYLVDSQLYEAGYPAGSFRMDRRPRRPRAPHRIIQCFIEETETAN